MLLEGNVHKGRRVAPVAGCRIVEGDIQIVAETLVGIMAGRTAHGPVTGQPPVEEKLFAEGNLGGCLPVFHGRRDVPYWQKLAGKAAGRQTETAKDQQHYESFHTLISPTAVIVRQ